MLELIVGVVVIVIFIIGVRGAWLIVKDKEREYWDRKNYQKMKDEIEKEK
jgi:hypothetical protein|tara:strand:- start:24 stop:173 length:150 start_codon:yes stop_codon:yes gene_type:complete